MLNDMGRNSRNTFLMPWNFEIFVVLKVRTTKENGSIFSEKCKSENKMINVICLDLNPTF